VAGCDTVVDVQHLRSFGFGHKPSPRNLGFRQLCLKPNFYPLPMERGNFLYVSKVSGVSEVSKVDIN